MTDEKLNKNEFYLVISKSGDILKTKNKAEAQTVSSWNGVIFNEVVSNSETIFYKIGGTDYKKAVSQIPISDSFEQSGCYHFFILDLHGGHHIVEIWAEIISKKKQIGVSNG